MYHQNCEFAAARLCGPITNTYEFKSITNHPLETAFETIEEEECIMYHGTSWEAALSIVTNGFNPDICYQPSIGFGTYLSPCVRVATSHTPDKIVIQCRVKLGKTKVFNEYELGYVRGSEDSTKLRSNAEFVVYDKKRILPSAMLISSFVYDENHQGVW